MMGRKSQLIGLSLLAVLAILFFQLYFRETGDSIKDLDIVFDESGEAEISFSLEDLKERVESARVLVVVEKVNGNQRAELFKKVQNFVEGKNSIKTRLNRLESSDSIEVTVNVIATDLDNIRLNVDQVDSTRIYETERYLARERSHRTEAGIDGKKVIQSKIESSFKRNGLLTKAQSVEFDSHYKGLNIIGSLNGITDSSRVIVLCAHYDAVAGSPGADDNASGIAGLLEAANLLSRYEYDFTIQLIAFDLEEEDFNGSNTYVNSLRKGQQTILGVINLDMIGYYSNMPNSQIIPEGFDQLFPDVVEKLVRDSARANFIINTSNSNSTNWSKSFEDLAGVYVPELRIVSLQVEGNGELTPSLASSDHAVFWQSGIPAISIGDGADTRNFNYHAATDSVRYLNSSFTRDVMKGTIAFIMHKAGIQRKLFESRLKKRRDQIN